MYSIYLANVCLTLLLRTCFVQAYITHKTKTWRHYWTMIISTHHCLSWVGPYRMHVFCTLKYAATCSVLIHNGGYSGIYTSGVGGGSETLQAGTHSHHWPTHSTDSCLNLHSTEIHRNVSSHFKGSFKGIASFSHTWKSCLIFIQRVLNALLKDGHIILIIFKYIKYIIIPLTLFQVI